MVVSVHYFAESSTIDTPTNAKGVRCGQPSHPTTQIKDIDSQIQKEDCCLKVSYSDFNMYVCVQLVLLLRN